MVLSVWACRWCPWQCMVLYLGTCFGVRTAGFVCEVATAMSEAYCRRRLLFFALGMWTFWLAIGRCSLWGLLVDSLWMGKQGEHTCRFPKIKEEGWFVILAQEEKGELLALKRVTVSGASRVSLVYPAVDENGSEVQDVTLYLLSDSYLGLDQQLNVGENGAATGQYVKAKLGQPKPKQKRGPRRTSSNQQIAGPPPPHTKTADGGAAAMSSHE